MSKTIDASVIVQARMGSSRLPGKTMMPLAGMRMLFHIVSRLQVAPITGKVVIATSDKPVDDFIESFADSNDIPCFRGSENDVLDRFWNAAKYLDNKYIVRATADNPLVWEGAVEHLGSLISAEDCEYMSYNHLMPVGLAVEMFTRSALEAAHHEAKLSAHREHVTPFIYSNKDKFDCLHVSPPTELQGEFRLTVDTQEDLQLVQTIYDRLYVPGEIIPARAAIELLRSEPELVQINAGVKQKTLED